MGFKDLAGLFATWQNTIFAQKPTKRWGKRCCVKESHPNALQKKPIKMLDKNEEPSLSLLSSFKTHYEKKSHYENDKFSVAGTTDCGMLEILQHYISNFFTLYR